MKIIIVGCGLSGITAARILKNKGHEVKIFETRNHIGGNCYDSNVNGVMLHNYGPHIFHTDDEDVFNFLNEFTEWIPFKLQPKGNTKLGLISLPYSKKTILEIGTELSEEQIIDVIFKDYSEKQWGVSFDQINKSIINRIPKTKDCEDPTWFEGQKYQCIPKFGYTKMFEKMLDGIEVKLNCDKEEWKNEKSDFIFFSGRIDEFYNFCYGVLPYRSLNFIHETSSKKMPFAILNENTKNNLNTRQYDHSYFTNDHKGQTIITKEYSKECLDDDIPFYPIPFGIGVDLYNKYLELSKKETNITFIGRLATYKYLDMWMAVKQVFLKIKNLNL
jgi:UDP-galactopyranose mutase